MSTVVVAALAVALVVCVIALVRETRLRRALQRLLKMIFERWRSHEQEHDVEDHDSSQSDRRRL